MAAKTLTHDAPAGAFHVTLFEASHRIGGLWPVSTVDDGLVNPDMCTNQSRHTVAFSDLAWEPTAPLFPKAWMVGRYLERYLALYGTSWDFRLRTKVVRSEILAGGRWKVAVSREGKEEEFDFDYLVVASGFSGREKMPTGLEGAGVPVVHSSRLRDVKSLLGAGHGAKRGKGKKIVVAGGQMSGVETAASIAMKISSAATTPGGEGIEDAGDYVVENLVQKPMWVLPFFLPQNPMVEVDGAQVCKAPVVLLQIAIYEAVVNDAPGQKHRAYVPATGSGHVQHRMATRGEAGEHVWPHHPRSRRRHERVHGDAHWDRSERVRA